MSKHLARGEMATAVYPLQNIRLLKGVVSNLGPGLFTRSFQNRVT